MGFMVSFWDGIWKAKLKPSICEEGGRDPWRLRCFLPAIFVTEWQGSKVHILSTVMLKILLSCEPVCSKWWEMFSGYTDNPTNPMCQNDEVKHTIFSLHPFFFWRVNHRIKKYEGCKVFHLTSVSIILDYLFCNAGKNTGFFLFLVHGPYWEFRKLIFRSVITVAGSRWYSVITVMWPAFCNGLTVGCVVFFGFQNVGKVKLSQRETYQIKIKKVIGFCFRFHI